MDDCPILNHGAVPTTPVAAGRFGGKQAYIFAPTITAANPWRIQMVKSLTKTGPLLLALAAVAGLCHGSGSSPLEDPCFTPISAVTCRLSHDDSGEACSWCSSELLPSKCLPPSMAKVPYERRQRIDACRGGASSARSI